jgi:Ca2+-binding RTX toxin-like protein
LATIRDGDQSHLIFGTVSGDAIFGDGGDDSIYGRDGDDHVFGGTGADLVNGGAGDDILEFRHPLDVGSFEIVNGGSGYDTLLLSSAGSVPGAGTVHFDFQSASISSVERLRLDSRANAITADILFYPLVPNPFSPGLEIVGGAGKDTINFHLAHGQSLDLRGATFSNWGVDDQLTIDCGDSNNCTVNGAASADVIHTGILFNELNGNGGDDLFVIDNPSLSETINGGSGWDTVAFQGTGHLDSSWLVNIEEIRFESAGASGQDHFSIFFEAVAFDIGAANRAFHFVDADAVIDNVAIGMSEANSRFSAAGFSFENWNAVNDFRIVGNLTDDRIIGSAVGDHIIGWKGADVLTGGGGSDSFDFYNGDSGVGIGNRDRILDFTLGDLLDLSHIDANASLAGDQAFVLDTDGVLAEGEIRLRGNLNTLVQLNLDADAEVDMEIVLCRVAPGSLTMDDFVL